jgi:hypothetical protein
VQKQNIEDQLKNPRSPFTVRNNTVDIVNEPKYRRSTPRRKVKSHRKKNDLSLVTTPISNRIQFESPVKLNNFKESEHADKQSAEMLTRQKQDSGIKFVKKNR